MHPFIQDLSIGSFGSEVAHLQKSLQGLGFGTYLFTGIFGPKTRNGVSDFQKASGILPADGYFGTKTRAAMNRKLGMSSDSILFSVAWSCLGTDVTPDDIVPDEVACAASVNAVFRKAFGQEIGGGASTALMREILVSDARFRKTGFPEPGCVVISATGLGKNPAMPHGHVGIVLDGGRIASNDSDNGLFETRYDLSSWIRRYVDGGGYPVEYFAVI